MTPRPLLFCALAALLTLLSSRARATEPIRGRVGIGTWATQAEFKDIKVTRGGRTLYASDFSRGATGWRTVRGQWQVVDGALRQTGGAEDTRALIGDPTWSDYTLTLKARKLGGREGFLILVGVPDDSTRTWWNLGGWGNTQHGIEGPGVAGGRVPGTIETGRWYDIKIALRGDTMQAYLDGRLVQTATQTPGTHTLVFSTQARGKKLPLTHWGLDTAWPVPDHIRRGLLYMGDDQVDTIRVSFPINEPLVDGDLPASKDAHFTTRLAMAKMAGDRPFTLLPDTEAGVHPWFKSGGEIIPERWVQLMAAAQRRYGKKMESVEAFNEPDYGWGQGSIRNLSAILGALNNSPDFAGVQLGGPSTLNADAARTWYGPNRGYLRRATTHSLGGSMDSYVNFYRTARADGMVADNPEVHNLAEVIAGAEYGLQSAIWWGTAERARGAFVNAVQGERLAYAEDRPRWSAAGVYRAPGGKVQAFVGASERMGETTTYRLVSRDRPVFFNGDGPRREYPVSIRRHGEVLVDITWGPDVPPKVGGRYVLVNRHSGRVLGVAGGDRQNGADIRQRDYTGAANQQWDIAAFVAPYGDQSYFTIRAVHSGKALDTADWNHDEGGRIQQWGAGDAGAQQWFFEYAGDNDFYIRSRWSTKSLEPAGGSRSAGAAIVQTARRDSPRQRWRLIPVSALGRHSIDSIAPRRPTGLRATTAPHGIALRWDAGRDADLAGYTVLRSEAAGGPYDTIARGVVGSRFHDTEARARRRYFYVVQAVDRSLNRSAVSAAARR